ncbi:type II and III secretion system protein family protein [Methyloferula stellata]|uniref:type II and III secretion system protein family protein n=1 Tax=Methyloferula stellata TaxID=876270 RepID=UPI000382761D|nr:type II and III secretion system protein family protein [Methyloferula stellata]
MKTLIPALLRGFGVSLFFLISAVTVHAEVSSDTQQMIGGVLTRRISMGVGKSIIVDLPRDASEIFIGNPKVANAVVRSARKLYVIGMENGQTTVFALDHDGHQIAVLELSIGRDTGELQQIIKAALPGANVTARTINDTIVLTGEVDSAEDAQRIGDIAQGFAKQSNGAAGAGSEGLVINSLVIRGRTQVMLKVTVAEIQRNVAKQLGLTSSTIAGSWGSFTQANPFAINGPLSSVVPNGSTNAVTTQLALTNPAGTLAANIQAFERYGVTRVLAEPTVAAVSGESATFMVGGQFPIPGPAVACSGTTSSVSTSSQAFCSGGAIYQNFGVALNFTPIVLAEGRILLHLSTEVTDVDFSRTVVIQGVPVPSLLTRKNSTSVELPSGGSIASAGLLQTQTAQVINGLPGLMNVPILGTLFRSRDYQRQETELMIIVTPYIVKPVAANELPRPDDGFADASDPQTVLLGRINKLYASPTNPQAVQNYKGHIGFIQD